MIIIFVSIYPLFPPSEFFICMYLASDSIEWKTKSYFIAKENNLSWFTCFFIGGTRSINLIVVITVMLYKFYFYFQNFVEICLKFKLISCACFRVALMKLPSSRGFFVLYTNGLNKLVHFMSLNRTTITLLQSS